MMLSKPVLKALAATYDETLSKLAFNFDLRHNIVA